MSPLTSRRPSMDLGETKTTRMPVLFYGENWIDLLREAWLAWRSIHLKRSATRTWQFSSLGKIGHLIFASANPIRGLEYSGVSLRQIPLSPPIGKGAIC